MLPQFILSLLNNTQYSLSSLLKTVKSAEDKASRGTRALEIAVDAVTNDIKALDNANTNVTLASPEVRSAA